MKMTGLQVHMHFHHGVPAAVVGEKTSAQLAEAHAELNQMGAFHTTTDQRTPIMQHIFGKRMVEARKREWR